MKLPNTAFILILWFVCQQVSAVTSGMFMGQHAPDNDPVVTTVVSTTEQHCNEPSEHTEATANLATQDECCEIDCDYSINGCQSLLSSPHNNTDNAAPLSPVDHYAFILLQSSPSSLFRPPILS